MDQFGAVRLLRLLASAVLLGSALAAQSALRRARPEEILHDEDSHYWERMLQGEAMSMVPTQIPSTKTYMALGDSLCAGQLPEPKGVVKESNSSYSNLFFEYLQEKQEFTTFSKLCCSEEDSSEFIDGSGCYEQNEEFESQLDAALQVIKEYDVDFITISLGANDLLPCLGASDIVECAMAQISSVVTNYGLIVTTLRQALNSTTVPIVPMTPYNAVIANLLSDVDAEQSQALIAQGAILNMRDALVANVFGPFNLDYIDALTVYDGQNFMGEPPTNVVNVCTWTGMCDMIDGGIWELAPGETRDIHPYPEGYQVLADAHIDLIEG